MKYLLGLLFLLTGCSAGHFSSPPGAVFKIKIPESSPAPSNTPHATTYPWAPSTSKGMDCYFINVTAPDLPYSPLTFNSGCYGLQFVSPAADFATLTNSGISMTVQGRGQRTIQLLGLANVGSTACSAGLDQLMANSPSVYVLGSATQVLVPGNNSVTLTDTYSPASDLAATCAPPVTATSLTLQPALVYSGLYSSSSPPGFPSSGTILIPCFGVLPPGTQCATPLSLASLPGIFSVPPGSGPVVPRVDLLFTVSEWQMPSYDQVTVNISAGAGVETSCNLLPELGDLNSGEASLQQPAAVASGDSTYQTNFYFLGPTQAFSNSSADPFASRLNGATSDALGYAGNNNDFPYWESSDPPLYHPYFHFVIIPTYLDENNCSALVIDQASLTFSQSHSPARER